jgi:microcystin-dependent protein
MSDQFVGEIRTFPFNFAPVGWALCDGQIMSISQNMALFSLIGTYYGGDGRSNFALPNFQGAIPVHQGTGTGLSAYVIGQSGGDVSVTLLQSQNGAHTHALTAIAQTATNANPEGGLFMTGHYAAGSVGGKIAAYTADAPNADMNATAIVQAGNGLPHNNMMPYLALNFCIALQGIFPQRS